MAPLFQHSRRKFTVCASRKDAAEVNRKHDASALTERVLVHLVAQNPPRAMLKLPRNGSIALLRW
jgi:hypothetical protein